MVIVGEHYIFNEFNRRKGSLLDPVEFADVFLSGYNNLPEESIGRFEDTIRKL